MKTFSPKENEIKREWYVVDAEGQILGRLASCIAHRLRGKHKPEFAPHLDTGDFIVVVNAEKIRVTGRKLEKKVYQSYSGYPGGIKEVALKDMLRDKPERVLYKAVQGMLPKNRIGRAQLTKLKIYVGPEHPHKSQNPAALDL